MNIGEYVLRQIASQSWFRRLGARSVHGRATIFMLHRLRNDHDRVGGHSLEEITRAVTILQKSGARFVRLIDLVEEARHGVTKPHAVAFTIDDGFADQAAIAECLVELGVHPTIFLISGFLDGELWPWDDRLAWALSHSEKERVSVEWQGETLVYSNEAGQGVEDFRNAVKTLPQDDIESLIDAVASAAGVEIPSVPPPSHKPMTWETVRHLESKGVDFAPHSRTHRIFSRIPDRDARAEIDNSIKRVFTEAKEAVPVFAWPTGRASDYTERDISILRQAGMLGCVATGDDYAVIGGEADGNNVFQLKRFSLPHSARDLLQYGTWVERFKQRLRGA